MAYTNGMSLSGTIPGLLITRTGASGTPFIRGVGSSASDPSSEPLVATYVDGVYIASPNVNLFDLYSISQIEVLKGPQGTLFATGGVIQVQTRDPSQTPSMETSLGCANYDTGTGAAYMTTGLSDTVAVNFAGQFRSQGNGYGHDIVTGAETYVYNDGSFRAKLLFEPSDLTRVLVAGDYNNVRSSGGTTTGFRTGRLGRTGPSRISSVMTHGVILSRVSTQYRKAERSPSTMISAHLRLRAFRPTARLPALIVWTLMPCQNHI
jgi:outer membrane receptor protein involved in Fe transport